jgi:DNA polymerase-1
MNRLIIIDGNAILHRAFHALPPLTSSDGTLTNAAYGFTSMLIRLIFDLTPTHIAVAFDRPKPTFRKELFKDYQIKRPKMDDGLAAQIPMVHDVLAAMRIPVFEQDGFEADDVIGTLCKHKPKTIDQIIIVTGDRDLLQLVTDTTKAYMPTKGLSEAKLYGPTETAERLGVNPTQIPDYKALAGDQSDNYPGVPGVGPKTAQGLITKFHTVEQLYKKLKTKKGIDDMSDSLQQKLITHKGLAILSKTLATIRMDVPMDTDIQPLTKEQLKTPEVIQQFERLGFTTLIKRLLLDGKSEAKATQKKKDERRKTVDEQMSLV